MGRPLAALVSASLLLLAGCGGDENVAPVPCDDAAFRGQDEELYVTQAVIANALGGAGDPATLLLDLRRARRALSTYLDLHPPCDADLAAIAATERTAIDRLDEAIGAIEDGEEADSALQSSLDALMSAQSDLFGVP